MDEIIYSKSVIEFVAVANEFCSFLERINEFSKTEFVNKAHKIMAFLYHKATMLPLAKAEKEGWTEAFVTEEDWNIMKENVAVKLGINNNFADVYSPESYETDDSESVSLSECFADIYQDTRNFVSLYNIGSNEVMYNALVECVINFEQFWGSRSLIILENFHYLLYSHENLEETDTGNPVPTDSEYDEG